MGNFGGDAGGVFYDYYEEEYSDEEDEDDYEAEVCFFLKKAFFYPESTYLYRYEPHLQILKHLDKGQHIGLV